MKPYYEQDGITIYHGDCREILPELEPVDVIITDPVWPNALAALTGSERSWDLFAEAATYFPRLTRRLVVQLGCGSDPRFLCGVPRELPFRRSCWLEYPRPGFVGRMMLTNDVAYVFGDWPPVRPNMRSVPGRMMRNGRGRPGHPELHPAGRCLDHVKWLVKWFALGTVLDPFMGGGTTLEACKAAGLPAIGIDIEERWCDMAARRVAQFSLGLAV